MCLDSLYVTSFPHSHIFFCMYRYPRPCSGIAPPEHAWQFSQVQMLFSWPIWPWVQTDFFSPLYLNVFLFRPDEAIWCVRPVFWQTDIFSPLPESFIFVVLLFPRFLFFFYTITFLSFFPETWVFNHNGKHLKNKKTETTSVMIESVFVSLINRCKSETNEQKRTNLWRKFHALRWRHCAWTQQMVTAQIFRFVPGPAYPANSFCKIVNGITWFFGTHFSFVLCSNIFHVSKATCWNRRTNISVSLNCDIGLVWHDLPPHFW
jgi:hypothetical protein